MSQFLQDFKKEIQRHADANVFFIAEYGEDGMQAEALCTTNPCQNIYSIAKACGCKFTYGSDSHDANSERKLNIVEKFLTQCGIRDCDMLTVDEILARNKS